MKPKLLLAAPVLIAGFSFFVSPEVKNDPFSAKSIEKNMAKVTDNLYAWRYETTNIQYRNFLNTLKENQPELYLKFVVDSAAWSGGPLTYQEPLKTYYFSHPAYAEYPVVTVPYEGALGYCQWLTGIYNNDPKRKFKKVEFTLPDTTQWMQAARGGRSQAMFPWGNYYLRNKQGEFLCNFKHIDESNVISNNKGEPVFTGISTKFAGGLNDRAFYTASVKTFYPNDFGIYNMSGNAAEMTIEKGITKGGSWNSYGGEVTIGAMKKYEKPSPEVGFRVFMNVIEK